ncbi:MAG: flagellar basal body L-ring protein FlgH [Inquilinus sp.]|nr:flagellar basal body L-ring protein FlgH [Inquilinus sp.]
MTGLPLSARHARPLLPVALVALLAGCGTAERIAQIGSPPPLSPIENPTAAPDYQPVRMPMPAPQIAEGNANSLWQTGARAFFRDQRAAEVGDILTVSIEIDDKASIDNQTQRSRSGSEDAGLEAFLGYEQSLDAILPQAIDNENLIGFESSTSNTGSGSISRGENIELKIAAVVVQILPNGNLAIYGRQEVRVNHEVRDLEIAGVIRPEDITSMNTIGYEKIAEARISYGGRGHISDVQQPRYGQQLYDIIFPF